MGFRRRASNGHEDVLSRAGKGVVDCFMNGVESGRSIWVIDTMPKGRFSTP